MKTAPPVVSDRGRSASVIESGVLVAAVAKIPVAVIVVIVGVAVLEVAEHVDAPADCCNTANLRSQPCLDLEFGWPVGLASIARPRS
jgi:hypothetical protein